MHHSGNHLRNEKSPYLQQHADNPVDWYPWGEEAFQKARKENKPIFLSIGYSTCHWCHVMEHESFEDEEIAEILNKHFVSIKVDREERPDVDHVYMQVCQAITGSGGWPLTVFLTPDKKPFFAGTYFPKESKYGRTGLKELLLKIADLWKHKQRDIIESADQIVTQLRKAQERSSGHSLNPAGLVEKAIGQLQSSFDEQYGGFGNAPKFPSPHNLLLIMEMEQKNSSEGLDFIVQKTLDNMAKGGIRDHIGGGFHRYSTDRFWLVPHFEKMLYDQAMLLMTYSKAAWLYGKDEYKQIAYEITEYVQRELMENKLFLSAEDADSEGEEGKFYLWTENELKELLDEDEFNLIKELSDISDSGNYVDEVHGGKTGKNIIHFAADLNSLVKTYNMNAHELLKRYNSIKQKLFNEREKRVHPFKDRKVLTDWNGLMITALIKAGIFLDDTAMVQLAKESFNRIVSVFRSQDGHLLHRHIDGHTDIPGKIDDYAWMIQAALQLFYVTQELSYLKFALEWSRIVLNEFEDKQHGGFFMYSENDESLILKAKELYDGAMPSGNSVMFRNLTDLYFLTAENGYREAIDRFLQYAIPEIERYPAGYTFFLTGIDRYLNPPGELIIVSEQYNPELLMQLDEFRKKGIPILWLNNKNYEIVKDIQYLKNYNMLNNQITYYFCRNFTCNLPVNDLELIKNQIK